MKNKEDDDDHHKRCNSLQIWAQKVEIYFSAPKEEVKDQHLKNGQFKKYFSLASIIGLIKFLFN